MAQDNLAALQVKHREMVVGTANAEMLAAAVDAITRQLGVIAAFKERISALEAQWRKEEAARRQREYDANIDKLADLLRSRETAALRIERAMRVVLKEVDAFERATDVVDAEWPADVATISLAFREHYVPTVSGRLRDVARAIDGFTEIVRRGHSDLIADWRQRGVTPDQEEAA